MAGRLPRGRRASDSGRACPGDLGTNDRDGSGGHCAAPAPVEDGVLPVAALVIGADEQPEGFINVWVERGYLSGLEYSWFTEMPTKYPPPDRLRLFDASPGDIPAR